MKRQRKGAMRVGQSKMAVRKIGGKRRRVRVTKMSKGKYRVRVVKRR